MNITVETINPHEFVSYIVDGHEVCHLCSLPRENPIHLKKPRPTLAQRLRCLLGSHGKPIGGVDTQVFQEHGLRYLRYHSYLMCEHCGKEFK